MRHTNPLPDLYAVHGIYCREIQALHHCLFLVVAQQRSIRFPTARYTGYTHTWLVLTRPRKHARAAAAQHYDHIWVTEWAAATAGSVPSAAPGSSTNPNPQLPSLTLKQLPAADSGAQGGCTQAGGEHNVRVTDADDVHVGGVGAGPGGLAQGGQRSSGSGATGAGPGWMEKEVVGSDGLGGRVEEGVWGEASSGEVGEGDVDVAVDGGPKVRWCSHNLGLHVCCGWGSSIVAGFMHSECHVRDVMQHTPAAAYNLPAATPTMIAVHYVGCMSIGCHAKGWGTHVGLSLCLLPTPLMVLSDAHLGTIVTAGMQSCRPLTPLHQFSHANYAYPALQLHVHEGIVADPSATRDAQVRWCVCLWVQHFAMQYPTHSLTNSLG